MIEYLKKFNSLPKDIRLKMSSTPKMKLIDELEQKYDINLASFVMRVMVADVLYNKQTATLVRELQMPLEKAKEIVKELKTKIFLDVADFLQSKRDIKFLPVDDIKKLPEKIAIDHLIANHSNNNIKKEDEEDKEEVTEFSKIINEIKKDIPIEEGIDATINQIIKEIKLSFSSEAITKRFKQSLSFYLNGSRSRINTREFFLKEIPKGGLNFEPILADRVLKIADTKIKRSSDAEKVNIKSRVDGTTFVFNDKEISKEKLNKITSNNTDYDLAGAIKKRATENRQTTTETTATVTNADVKDKAFNKDSVLGKGNRVAPVTPSKHKKRISASAKNKMHDIKPVSGAMNPIDELRYMDLVTFRRMGSDIKQRVKKIEEKIDLISEEGITKRLEGISAWKNSPINNIYLQIGKQSISQGLSVEEVIAAREKEGKDVLEINEFEEILDLNNNLRF